MRFSRLQLSRAAHISLASAAALWLGTAAWSAVHFAESHRRYDLPALANYAERQIHHVRTFLATADPAALRAEPYPKTPHPDPAYLAQLLGNPRVHAFLPPELNDVPPPPLSRFATDLRSTSTLWLIAGTLLLLATATRTFHHRPRFRPRTPPASSSTAQLHHHPPTDPL